MLTQSIFDFLFNFVMNLLDLLPDIDFSIPSGIITGVVEAFQVIFYVLPMGTVFGILSIVFALHSFRILICLIKTLWDLLPIA